MSVAGPEEMSNRHFLSDGFENAWDPSAAVLAGGLALLDALGRRDRAGVPGLDFRQHGVIGVAVGLGALLIGLPRRRVVVP